MATPPLGAIEIANPDGFFQTNVAGVDDNVAWFAFTLEETHWVNIDTINSSDVSGSRPDTRLVLYDSGGNIIENNDDDPTTMLGMSRIVRQLAASTYYIAVGMSSMVAASDCVASSPTPIVEGVHLYTEFYPDPPSAEAVTTPHASAITLDPNPKWFSLELAQGQTLNVAAPDCKIILYNRAGSPVFDDSNTLQTSITLGGADARATFWVAVTQIGGFGYTYGPDFLVTPDGVYGGSPIDVSISATGGPGPVGDPLEWYARYAGSFGVWSARPATGSEEEANPHDYYGGRAAATGTSYVWTIEWQTTGGDEPVIVMPNGPDPSNFPGGNVGWPAAFTAWDGSTGSNYGELRMYCSVDGVPQPGYLWLAWTPNAQPFRYADVAWGYDNTVPEVPPFWTGFNNTFEIP